MLFIYRTVCSHSHAARRGAAPPLHVPSPQKKSPALPTAQISAASQLPNPWCSSGEERACQRLGLALLLMEKHFPTSEQILPTLAGSPKGPCLYLGMSPRAQGSLRQPEGLQPTPWVQEAFKGPISSPPLILQEPNSHSKLNLGWGCYLCPFFFGVLEVQKAPQARRAASHRNARVFLFAQACVNYTSP